MKKWIRRKGQIKPKLEYPDKRKARKRNQPQ